jgi:hypothetical protein
MNKKINKNGILYRISSVMMIFLAVACNILTVALLSTVSCVKAPVPEDIVPEQEISNNFMYIKPDAGINDSSIEDTDVYYAINVVVSDKNGKAAFVRIKPPLVIKTK